MEIFRSEFNWYKGNLHTHTSISDGLVSPEECIRLYKNAGYHFLSITDHRRYFKGFQEENFLILNGAEFHFNDMEARKAYHITGIGIDDEIYTDDGFTPQQVINSINSKNGLAIIAHPAWSLLTHDDLMSLHGYCGVEIWNTVSETDSGRGDSTSYIDVLASKGRFTLIFAVDDTHFYRDDLFGGYIMVNSPSLKEQDIMDSIRKGRFYCSQGPEIKQITIGEGRIQVETSPVRRIAFLSDTFYCKDRICKSDGQLMCGAVYEIKPTDRFVRVECQDADGKKAWSQLIRVGG